MNFEILHPADQLVMIMERIYGYGMTTTSGGNLSIKDENEDVWITPAGVDKGSLTADDIVCVKPDGKVIGKHKPSSELPFHLATYKQRKDIKALIHAHPPALVAFSIARKLPNTKIIPNVDLVCGKTAIAKYGLPGSDELGENIAKELKNGTNTILLENHGVVVVGKDLFSAFMAFETFDFCARIEINARKFGEPIKLSEKNISTSKKKQDVRMKEFELISYSSKERKIRKEMCKLIHRSYEQNLFTSTQGTFSARLEKNNFIITPYGKDRRYLNASDLVRIENDKCEAGKNPSRSALLHKYIYEKHPHINSIIIAHPPNIMAFAITNESLDSRTIPESYILLRDIPKLPFGSSFMQPEMTADQFVKKCPVALFQNDCVIVTGDTLLNAFDRLEVAEYSAKAIISTRNIGEIIKINDKEVKDIEKAFGLET